MTRGYVKGSDEGLGMNVWMTRGYVKGINAGLEMMFG